MQVDDLPISVIYSDDQLIVVDKPAGLLSVPGRGEDKWDCLVHRVQKQFPTARIVHRLDCATSGLMVLALDADTHRALSRQFHDRDVDKLYEAIVYGSPSETEGSVEQPLITDWPNRPRQKVCYEHGKQATTHYTVMSKMLYAGIETARVALKPITGRSHQLRVHMQYLGHPIIGDGLYAEDEALNCADRLCLHACELSITHPSRGERLEFRSDAPF